tara:strand:+ start:375 stop:1496 length:1122 start_codon:yes stop_codon:yes gene_type:complete
VNFLKKILKSLKSLVIIIFITFAFSLIVDFFFGNKILEITDSYWKKTEFYGKIKRIDHDVFHHGLKPNVKMKNVKGFENYYTFCTDNHGFRYKCNSEKRGKTFDYGFMGDSFTEGSSVSYEDSFVGIFENKIKKDVANLGVVSYAPKIYLSKLKYYLDKGYNFKDVIVAIDISDLYDDNVSYRLKENFTVEDNYERGERLKFRRFLRKNFPFTNFYMFVIKNLNTVGYVPENKDPKVPVFHKDVLLKGKWTYSSDKKIDGYWTTTKEAQTEMIENMDSLSKLLSEKNIPLSIVIFPWPQQLENDVVNSKHVRMWEEFCEKKCKNFINLFPILFNEKEKNGYLATYKKYYWWNDMHFNLEGNRLLANKILEYFQ